MEKIKEEKLNLEERTAVKPNAWTPIVTLEDSEGEIITKPQTQPMATWDEILVSSGLDPKIYELVQPVKLSVWDQQTKEGGVEKLYSYRAGIKIKQEDINNISYDDLVREIKKHRPLNKNLPDGDSSFVVCIADLQLGKNDNGGVKETVERFLTAIDSVEQRIRDLRKIGRNLGTLVVAGLADIIENCQGNYASQIFRVELNLREQVRLARRLIRDAIARWSKMFKKVIVLATPGNHGAYKPAGKEVTTPGDNFDVSIFETIQEIFEANPEAYGHIEFIIPEDEISVTTNISGVNVCFTHGHITTGGGSPQQRIKNWWEGQSFGNQEAGKADILITGHYHHLSVIQYGKKVHIMCPTLDSGSEYFVNLTGQDSPPGLLTLVIGENITPGGWSDMWIA